MLWIGYTATIDRCEHKKAQRMRNVWLYHAPLQQNLTSFYIYRITMAHGVARINFTASVTASFSSCHHCLRVLQDACATRQLHCYRRSGPDHANPNWWPSCWTTPVFCSWPNWKLQSGYSLATDPLEWNWVLLGGEVVYCHVCISPEFAVNLIL